MLKPEKRRLLIRVYNTLANRIGFGQKLDFDQIIRKSRTNTNLHDFGSDFNEASLRNLILSANDEARLHPFGILMIKEKLISQLENRLWAEYWFKKYPEILDQEVLPVVLITGLQRTGTTKMQRLLSGHPEARPLLSWEALYPAPLEDINETGKRISRTKRNEKAVSWISPTFQSIHPIHSEQPEEDVLLLDVHFMSSSMEAILNVPSYAHWLSEQKHEGAYLYELKLLKLLQWQKRGKFWVLKSPHHLEYLHLIRSVFHDVKIIWMHRPVEDSIPSFLSMLYYSRAMFSAEVEKQAIIEQWLPKLTKMLKSGLDFKRQHPNEITDVFFDDFLDSENKVMEEIQESIPFISKKFTQETKNIEMKYVSKHKYNLQDWNLNFNDLDKVFNFYHKEVFHSVDKKSGND